MVSIGIVARATWSTCSGRYESISNVMQGCRPAKRYGSILRITGQFEYDDDDMDEMCI